MSELSASRNDELLRAGLEAMAADRKPPCFYPLEGRRCCECAACHAYNPALAAQALLTLVEGGRS